MDHRVLRIVTSVGLPAPPSAPSVWRSWRQLERPVWIVAVARAVNTMGFSMVMPFMAMYIVEHEQGSGTEYGTIYLIAGLGAAISQAIAGELADRHGRRRVMLTALALRACNFVALGSVVLLDSALLPLAILIVVNGVLRAQFEPAASATVTEHCAPDHRVAAFGLQRIGVNLGWSMGPALGGYLASFSYGVLFFVAAAATLVTAVLVARLRDKPRPRPATDADGQPQPWTLRGLARGLRGNRVFVAYLGLVFLGSIMTVQLFSTLSVYANLELGMSKALIGVLYTVNGLAVILLQVPAVSVIDRAGPKRALLFGPALYTVAYVGIGLSDSFGTLALAVIVLTAGEVVFAPALSDMAVHLGDPKRLGRAFGLFGLMQQLGVSVGPLVGGLAYDHLRHDHLAMWGALAGGMAVVGLGYLVFALRWRGAR